MAEPIDNLLELAENILALEQFNELFISLVERYSTQFSVWYHQFLSETARYEGDTSLLAKVELLSAQHDKILDLTKKYTSLTAGELRALNKRGKVMMSYVDDLPKRISIRHGRKG